MFREEHRTEPFEVREGLTTTSFSFSTATRPTTQGASHEPRPPELQSPGEPDEHLQQLRHRHRPRRPGRDALGRPANQQHDHDRRTGRQLNLGGRRELAADETVMM